MKQQILKKKILIYLLLVVLTAICAWLSFRFYEKELEKRAMPQVTRAMAQVAKLLPQLEENEQAVREVYESLEKSRGVVYKKNEDTLEASEPDGQEGENPETIINHTLSWLNRVTMLKVGRRGHVIVISQDDYTILAHPDEQFVGETLRSIGKMDPDGVRDISEDGNEYAVDRFYGFFPASFFKEKISPARFWAAADAGVFGSIFAYKDTYILCGITLFEAISFVIVRTFFTTLFFFLIAWVFVCYIGFSLVWQKEEDTRFRSKLRAYAVIAVIVTFALTWYYQTMMDMTGDIATMNEHAQVAVENLNTYRSYRDELSQWLDDQYLEQCRLAVDLVNGEGKEYLTRQDLAEYAKELRVKYIYVFDKEGKVMVTNSPYDHFELSDKEEDQSYAFRTLLDGREYVVQAPGKDDVSGDVLQYIGVSLRDEDDLADGFVQIAVDPGLRERLLSPIGVQTVLDNLVIGLPDYALAIDKNSGQIVATTGLGFEKEDVKDLGIDVENLKKDFNGIFKIKGNNYYAGVSESEDLFLMPLARGTDNKSALMIALKLMLFAAAAFALLTWVGLSAYKQILAVRETQVEAEEAVGTNEAEKDTAEAGKEAERPNLFSGLTDVLGVKEKTGFDSRWKRNDSIPVEQQTPEMRTGRIIKRILLVFAIVLILFEVAAFSKGKMTESLDGFAYVLLGNWQKGFNLFSLSYCLFLLSVMYVIWSISNEVLYRIAKFSNLHNETIFLLLRNALKYACALLFLYIGLAKFGIDTKTLWASVGVLSLIVGLGAKDLINDVIAGLFIIFEGTYMVGDYVMIGNWFGVVEEIGIRYTKISWYGDTKIFNNSSVRDIVTYKGPTAKESIKIPIPYETDLTEVEKLLDRELPKMAEKIPGLSGPPVYKGVSSFQDNCILLSIDIYCDNEKRRSALRALYREFKLLFDREHIEIHYSPMVVREYNREASIYTFSPEEEEMLTEDAAEGQEAKK